MEKLLCWLGRHRLYLRMTPIKDQLFIDAPCERCGKILAHQFLIADIIFIKTRQSSCGIHAHFTMETVVIPEV